MVNSPDKGNIFDNTAVNYEKIVLPNPAGFKERVISLKESGSVLLCLLCLEDPSSKDVFRLVYLFENFDYMQVSEIEYVTDGSAISVSELFPVASLYEREISDGFGVVFEGSYDRRRLFLHESYPDNFHPLRKSFLNGPVKTRDEIPEEDLYEFKRLEGKGVYEVAVGPVHAGIIEPGHFRFSVIGETIFNLETRFYYLHRGIEKLAEGKKPDECLKIAESVSGDEAASNSVCLCLAVERIAGIKPSLRAEALRGIALEMERICSLLSDCAGMLIDVGYPIGASPFMARKEECMRIIKRLFGHRFMRGYMRIGGVSHDIVSTELLVLESFIAGIEEKVKEAYNNAINSSTLIDRLATTGIIEPRFVRPLNLTGPVGRASGSRRDVRTDYPYGIYKSFTPELFSYDAGDVLSRFMIKSEDIMASARFIRKIICEMPEGEINDINHEIPDGCAFAMVESARGQNLTYLNVYNGRVWRYKVRTASFTNWLSIEHAVMNNIVPDFPVINKSLNLSYSGNDL